jgi:hypothetical protein
MNALLTILLWPFVRLLITYCIRFNWIGKAVEWVTDRPLAQRMRRQEQGLCEECGYDIRASPVRCPECGHFVSPTARMFVEYRRKHPGKIA